MWHPIDDHATKIGNQKMEKIVFSQSVVASHTSGEGLKSAFFVCR
jgi:hypothetical protein